MKSLTNNNLGKNFLVEQCQKIEVKSYIKDYKSRMKEMLLTTILKIDEQQVCLTTSRTFRGGYRYWFTCPKCNKRAGVLFRHPYNEMIACRVCLGLDYGKRRFKGMVESKLT